MTKKINDSSVNKILKTFVDNLTAIEVYFDKFGNLAENEDENGFKKNQTFVQNCLEEVGIDYTFSSKGKSENDELNIPREVILSLAKKLDEQSPISVKNFEILANGSFLMLNNYFEYLLADLLSYYYSKFKKSLGGKEFKLVLNELEEYENISDLTDSLITKEVESMIIDMSFENLKDHFNKSLKIDLNEKIIDWNFINECRERRHILVHNSCIVNKKYISRTKNPYNLKIGDKVHISREYFLKAWQEFRLAGMLLSFDCWGQWDKEKIDFGIESLVDESFESLKRNELKFCYNLTVYGDKIEARNEKQENSLLSLRFNKAIALKKMGKKNDLDKLLKNIKVGTASPTFKLAHAILSEKEDEIILSLIKKSTKINEINLTIYNEWPIFEFVRKNDKLNNDVLNYFNEDVSTSKTTSP
ncbi:hypothetical protein V1389_13360 [Flavobacterium rakeshii]|uniref:hypothetical protein n=1 Tax=Flavobacterium rakeshii TaxID=1038845 RepID=UPI002E7BDB05|nr:hypothetical protein [Flavobacterium rakeshii]MEE1899333.1 hypothetical protein [Flavobacterium rakeshii]